MSLDEHAKRQAILHEKMERLDDPDFDAKLDRFMAEYPLLLGHYDAMGKDELVRRLMAQEMDRAKRRENVRKSGVLRQWMNENPQAVARIRAGHDRILAKADEQAAAPLPKAPGDEAKAARRGRH